MFARLHFGKGHVDIDRIINCACPNFCGGIGNITVHCAEIGLWTGEVHLFGKEFTFPFGKVIRIEKTEELGENSESPWITVWKQPEKFTYEPWYEAAQLLSNIFAGEAK